MSNCPECDRPLTGNRCACGWSAPVEPPPRVNWHQYEVIKPTENNFRKKWREKMGDVEPPLHDCGAFQCVGGSMKPLRQPGEDSPEDIGHGIST